MSSCVLAGVVALFFVLSIGCGVDATPAPTPTPASTVTPALVATPTPTATPSPASDPTPTPTCIEGVSLEVISDGIAPSYRSLDDRILWSDTIVRAKLTEISYRTEGIEVGCDTLYRVYAVLEFRVFETLRGNHRDSIVVDFVAAYPDNRRRTEERAVARGRRLFEQRIVHWMDREAILFLNTQSTGVFRFSTIWTSGWTQFTIDDRYNKVWLPETDQKGIFYQDSPNNYHRGRATPTISLERLKVVIEEVLTSNPE